MIALRPFQRDFIRRAFAPTVDTACLSLPRGNGKSTLAGAILARALTPGDPWNVPGREYILLSVSLEQARAVFNPLREWLEPIGEYRFIDSVTRVGATHLPSRTRLRVLSSNPRTAQGIVRTEIAVCDEPGAWQDRAGAAMYDALATAQGKPGSRLRTIFIGTLAPATSGWWHDLVAAGSHGSTYVMARQGDPETWDNWHTIRKANPLVEVSATFRRKLLEERDAARRDPRLKARFLSFRLNVPTMDERKVLVSVPDWQRVEAREVPPREGRPFVGWDSGASRSWTAAWATWPNGRAEAYAVVGGVPSLEDRERADSMPRGAYRQLVDDGALRVVEGRRMTRPEHLVDLLLDRGIYAESMACDLFLAEDLEDVVDGRWPLEKRRPLWSHAQEDITAFRGMVLDGTLAPATHCRTLIRLALSQAVVEHGNPGGMRIRKLKNNRSRDDVALAGVLSAGLLERAGRNRPARLVSVEILG